MLIYMFQMRIFSNKLNFSLNKKDRRSKIQKMDLVREQVKKMLTETDQKLILMVRG